MKLSFSTLGCPGWDIPAVARKAAEYGFDGVELRVGGDKHVDPAMDAAQRAQTRSMFELNGVAICCLAGYTTFWDGAAGADFLARQSAALIRNAELAHDLYSPLIRTFMGGEDFPEDFPRVAEALHNCAEAARALGVTVVLETHDSVRTGKQARGIADRADSPGFGVLWDILQPVLAGEAPAETFRHLIGVLKHVQIKDAVGHKQTLPGEGNLPIAEILGLLADGGYGGYLSFEWEKLWIPELPEPETAFPRYMEFMRKLLSGR